MIKKTLPVVTFVVAIAIQPLYAKPAKIVGLVPARNESIFIAQCLKALALYTDSIVYLDDASDDGSLAIVEALAQECRVEKIITKKVWYRDEPGDRNALLQAGRALGGTHFICLDADEMFTANCLNNNFLKKQILALRPGERLQLTWIQLWRKYTQYRFDSSVWTNCCGAFIFCDDQECFFESEFIHTSRTPQNLSGKIYTLEPYKYGVLHFQFINWRNLLIKQAWYRCLERIRNPNKPLSEINARYAPSKNEDGLALKKSPQEWFRRYSFFDSTAFDKSEKWREAQILSWFTAYGVDFFRDLDIWDIDWSTH
jgi:glycosyltransferase involved in cell wall biosynthesis